MKKQITTEGRIKAVKGGFRVILSKEIVDRDGEVILIDGINIDNYRGNPVLIDAHNMHGSVVDNVLGKIIDIEKTIQDGVRVLQGTLVFVDTPRGKLARKLVEGGFVSTVSIQFSVQDYDADKKHVLKSELYETSLVSVPANVGAVITTKGKKTECELNDELVKRLKNYEVIHPVIKAYRKLLMSDKVFELLNLEKGENEIANIEILRDSILSKQENPVAEAKRENPDEVEMTVEELSRLIGTII